MGKAKNTVGAAKAHVKRDVTAKRPTNEQKQGSVADAYVRRTTPKESE
ncbi:hypothetical protein ACWECC_23830 [Streptomyces microflavus]